MPSDPLLDTLLAKFTVADCCWFASTRPDGKPHLAPIWHVWHEGAAYVMTKGDSVRARNIARNSAVSLSLPDPMQVLIIEGTARFAPRMTAAVSPLFLAKYNWEIENDAPYDMLIAVDPVKIMAWGAHGEGRWQWPQRG